MVGSRGQSNPGPHDLDPDDRACNLVRELVASGHVPVDPVQRRDDICGEWPDRCQRVS